MLKTRLYLIHMLGGLVVLITLGIHMVIQHMNKILAFFGFDNSDPTSWASMSTRSGQIFWLVTYIVLLAFLLYHMLFGLRGIILETSSSARTEKVVTLTFVLGGILVFIWCTYILFYLFMK